jgi:hypothetical protein
MTPLYVRIAFTSLLLLTAHHPAIACASHAENRVCVSHQRSAAVSLALHDAKIAGILPSNTFALKNGEDHDGNNTMGRLQRFGNALASSGAKAASGLSLLLVEEGRWSRYRTVPDGVVFQIETRGAQADETVVITGATVLAAMDDGRLSFNEALARGLIVLVSGASIDDGNVWSALASFAKADHLDQTTAASKQQRMLYRPE